MLRAGFPVFLSSLIGLVVLTGCGRYQLGAPGAERSADLLVLPVLNLSDTPGLEIHLNQAIRRQIAETPGFRLVRGESSADYILEAKLVSFERELGARRSEDTARALSLSFETFLEITLRDARTGTILLENVRLREEGFIYDTLNFAEAERQNAPRLARDLGQAVARRLQGFLFEAQSAVP
jgi:hypothetical protein